MSNPVDEKSAAEIKAALQNNNQALAIAQIKECLEKANNTPLNIGVTGGSGSGKSSFVNGFRGINDTDDGAAPTDYVETTTHATKYTHPSYPNVTLWDLPCIGSMEFSAIKYLQHVEFEKYDFFIIISDTYFRENDVTLAKEILKMGKKFYFVRSKVDNDVNAMKRSKKGLSDTETLEEVKKNCIEGLQNEGSPSTEVFLVSRFELDQFDFPLLYKTLQKELPEQKRDVLLLAMPNTSLEVINEKKEVFQNQITLYAFISSFGAAMPIAGASVTLDLGLLVSVTRGYMVGFCLDEESLNRLANSSGVPLADLKSVLNSQLALNKITPDLVSTLLLESTSPAALVAAEGDLGSIPIIGTTVAATLSFKVTQNALQTFLNMLAEDTQRVFKKALSSDSTV